MTSETQRTGLSLKRVALIVITVLVGVVMAQSLIASWSQPQVASRLQLYQSDLLLQASAWNAEELPAAQRQTLMQGLLGQDPLEAALEEYQEVRQTAASFAGAGAMGQSQAALVPQLDLRIGLIQAQRSQLQAANQAWQAVVDSDVAPAPLLGAAADLQQLWQGEITPTAEVHFNQALEGWFRYRALEKLYDTAGASAALATLQAQEQTQARSQLVRLGAVATVPGIGAMIGLGLLVGLVVQRVTQPTSLLKAEGDLRWPIPWNGEVIWQVLVVGFFFVGQIFLPLLLGILGVSFAGVGGRGRALYSLVYYLLMASGGITVLVLSIRAYRPLPPELFRVRLGGRWWLWGLGGYLVALPLMLAVALVNQQIWQGSGGSNPLLQTVLQEQDPVALGLFFFTAAVAAPVFEELLFRGFLLPSLAKYMPVGVAIATSSLIFAVAHLSLSEMLPLAVLGSVLGFVYTRSRNLLAPMLLHSAWNSATMLGLFLLGSR